MRSTLFAALNLITIFTIGCGSESPANTGDSGTADAIGNTADGGVQADAKAPPGLTALGSGEHRLAAMKMTVIATADDGLAQPSDIAFHPKRNNELWITNRADDSMVLIFGIDTVKRQAGKANGPGNQHFLANPIGLAFGENGNLATIHDEDRPTQATTPGTFMGPTLWSSSLTVFNGGHGGHLDMLHNSPLGRGIAWESGNTYWIFDGAHNSLTRYAFNSDHGPGGSDHRDGDVGRFVEGEVKMVADSPSHLAYDPKTKLLYVADSGNNRIVVLDTQSGKRGATTLPNFDGSQQYRVDGGKLTTLIEGSSFDLKRPAGLEIRDNTLYIADNETGRITAFALDGKRLDWLDTELEAGTLFGITFDDKGRLLAVDSKGNRVLRFETKVGQ